MSGKNTHMYFFYFWFKNKQVWAEKIGKKQKNSKNLNKPELFDLVENGSWSRDDMGLICHTPHLCTIFKTNILWLCPCVYPCSSPSRKPQLRLIRLRTTAVNTSVKAGLFSSAKYRRSTQSWHLLMVCVQVTWVSSDGSWLSASCLNPYTVTQGTVVRYDNYPGWVSTQAKIVQKTLQSTYTFTWWWVIKTKQRAQSQS